jgi:hypothetical protein
MIRWSAWLTPRGVGGAWLPTGTAQARARRHETRGPGAGVGGARADERRRRYGEQRRYDGDAEETGETALRSESPG